MRHIVFHHVAAGDDVTHHVVLQQITYRGHPLLDGLRVKPDHLTAAS
jgi:hypothetical protein